ncbi:nucleolar transcription factor 1-B-like [Hypomesus transpacificus]|uniref:nucleolar transcription factor 1-B-like n=1 Tax=Hypomesus transpacificus TaxID=137520 RepID=UPI001F07481D|nr:nucleolar transcription factor 1-B-like [Hypomesus transpacificus]
METCLPIIEQAWNKEDLQRLFSGMKDNIPKRDMSVYSQRQKKMNWEKVAFHPYTAEMCDRKWKELSKKIRKIRTLSELISDAEVAIDSPFKQDNLKVYAKGLKRPCPPNAIFYQEKHRMFEEQHPEMNAVEILKLTNKEYKGLPEEEKGIYIEKFQAAKKQYTEEKEHRRNLCLDFIGLCSPVTLHGLPNNDEQESLPASTKTIEECPMDTSTKANKEPSLGISNPPDPKENKTLFPGEPKKPPAWGHTLFCSEQMEKLELHHLSAKQRLALVRPRWKELNKKEKEDYQRRAKKSVLKYSVELQIWFSHLSAIKKAEFLKHNPRKHAILNHSKFCKEKKRTKESQRSRKRTSDSEDDEIDDTSSEKSDDDHSDEDENVSDEEECLKLRKQNVTASSSDGSSSEED